MPFHYSLASDLHMDFPQPYRLSVMPWERNILIAGDLFNGLGALKFIEKMRRKGHVVYACDGNHDHYANRRAGRSIADTEKRFYELYGDARQVYLGDGLYLISCNGWYPVADSAHWKNYMSDGELVGCASEVNETARRHAEFVGEALVRLPHDAKAIVMTHTAPCEQSLDPKYEGSDENQYYWNPMMEHVLVTCAKSIVRWHHGHTHAAMNVTHAGVPIITNPRGYPGEVQGWKPLNMSV